MVPAGPGPAPGPAAPVPANNRRGAATATLLGNGRRGAAWRSGRQQWPWEKSLGHTVCALCDARLASGGGVEGLAPRWSGGRNVGPCTDPADSHNWSRRWWAVRTARKPAAPPCPGSHSAMAAALGHGRKKSGRACACGRRCIAGHLKRLQVPFSFALVSQHPNQARSTRECAVNLERGPRRLTQTPVPLCFSLDTALSLPDTGWILME